ncbi:aldehyde dehydrogenase family protein [Streptomyces sp. NPDC019443]|uniref:aldehyde dehydrogenase family protein n=1 Tax=Streptomyces sp. NPDC019443 TaxID=3365061 RepID=UPI00378F426C
MDAARSAGAHVHTGGLPHGLPPRGAYYPPTVTSRAPEHSDVLTKELFGSLVTVHTFTTEDEPVRLANATEYGLHLRVDWRHRHGDPTGAGHRGRHNPGQRPRRRRHHHAPSAAGRQSRFGGAEKTTEAFAQSAGRRRPASAPLTE